MKFLSVCSGIEAASVAWQPLGFKAVGFSEIEKFPCRVLEHHYPEVTNFGSLLDWRNWNAEKFDILVGGTPCQDFLIAGKKQHGERADLTFEFIRMAGKLRPEWIVWENVPGVLSMGKGKTFARILQAFSEFGYGVAWRILDAQNFGVPQRRRRVFLIGHSSGDPRSAGKVLFEPESLRGDIKKVKARQISETDSRYHQYVCGCGYRFDLNLGKYGCPNCEGDYIAVIEDRIAYFRLLSFGKYVLSSLSSAIKTNILRNDCDLVFSDGIPRKITPLEALRLQGFPDDYLINVSGYSDTQAYKAVGNSMAVPVMRWIGERIKNDTKKM